MREIREHALVELSKVLAGEAPAVNQVRNSLNFALEHGATHEELAAGRQWLQAYFLSQLEEVLARPEDTPGYVRTVHSWIEAAMRQGATRTQLATGWKVYGERLTNAAAASLQAEDLVEALDLLQHARTHAREQLASTIASTEAALRKTAADLVASAPEVARTKHHLLGPAIRVARTERLTEVDISAAEAVDHHETARKHTCTSIDEAINEDNHHKLLEHLGEATNLGLTDPEVATGRSHAQAKGTAWLQSALAVGADGMVAAAAANEDLHRALKFATRAGVGTAELEPARQALTQRAQAKVQRLHQASSEDPDSVLRDLDEYESAVRSEFLSPAEREDGRAKVSQKMMELVAARKLPLSHHVKLLDRVAHESDVDRSALQNHTAALHAEVLQELQSASQATDAVRLQVSIDAAGAVLGIAGRLQVDIESLEQVVEEAHRSLEQVHHRSHKLDQVDRYAGRHGVAGLRAALAEARAAGVPEAALAAYEERAKEKEVAIAAAKAKVAAALADAAAGGRRLAAAEEGGSGGPSREEVEAALAPLRAALHEVTVNADAMAERDDQFDQLKQQVEELEARLSS